MFPSRHLCIFAFMVQTISIHRFPDLLMAVIFQTREAANTYRHKVSSDQINENGLKGSHRSE